MFFKTYVLSDEELESYPHFVLTGGEIEWDPNGIEMSSNRPYGNNMKAIKSAGRVCEK